MESAGRVPPQDLDAEAATLAAILLEKNTVKKVRQILPDPSALYSPANGRILEACYAVIDEGKPIDITTVASWLRSREWLDGIGGAGYLAQIVDATPSTANVSAHARTVAEKWQLRKVIATCQRIAAEGYGDVGEHNDFLNGAVASVRNACSNNNDSTGRNIDAIMHDVYKDLMSDEPDDTEGIYTGIWALDNVNGPLRPGSVTTVLAYSSHGKSAFCACLVNFASQHGAGRAVCTKCGDRPPCPWRREYITLEPGPEIPVCEHCGGEIRGKKAGILVFSGEMRDKDYGKRMVQIRSKVSLRDFKRGRVTPDERNAVLFAIEDIRQQKDALWIDDKTVDVIKLRSIVAQKRVEMAENDIELVAVVFDYAQRAKYGKGNFKGNRQQELAEVGRHLKGTALQENVAIVLPAQLNEIARQRGLKPNAENVREAQDLVMDSDNTIVIYAPHRDASVDVDLSTRAHIRVPEPVQFRVGKGRDGQRGFVPGAFLPWITTFDTWRSSYGEYVLPEEHKEEKEYKQHWRR